MENEMKKIVLVAGARPNFMKIAPILREIEKHPEELKGILVHTGQHYDHNMSDTFFKSLGIKEPDYNLEVGSGSHAFQTAEIMVRFEEVCVKENPDLVLVVGDVNSTIAAGLVAKKSHVSLAHVEAGLRSRDWSMPEEINRIATDAITDMFFTTEKEGTQNLLAEGHAGDKVHFVGHVMIDNLFYQLNKFNGKAPSELAETIKSRLLEKYICMTMHRPSNVDDKETLERIIGALQSISENAPIVFPCHPRTKKQIEHFGFQDNFKPLTLNLQTIDNGIYLTEPLGYDDFLYLWKDASLVITDSGGVQEETTALKIPCITIRENTERPITVEVGSNVVVGTDPDKIIKFGKEALNNEWKESKIPDLWDGRASERIVKIIREKV
jgi:UDP-N-acetylglucosamine 2-epimerase (non-hydrolysing)